MMEPFMRSKAQAWMMVLRELTILGWFVTASHALSTMLIVKTRSHDCQTTCSNRLSVYKQRISYPVRSIKCIMCFTVVTMNYGFVSCTPSCQVIAAWLQLYTVHSPRSLFYAAHCDVWFLLCEALNTRNNQELPGYRTLDQFHMFHPIGWCSTMFHDVPRHLSILIFYNIFLIIFYSCEML